jgi:hypothetical protein
MKITYLFGAGASSATIPLAAKLGADIGPTAELFRSGLIALHNRGGGAYPEDRRPFPKGAYGKALFEALDWLCKTALNHTSVDTIARKLWMRGDSDSMESLTRLKATLGTYLWYKQISQPSDRRYDTFLATLLRKASNGKPVLPDTVRLLTWNYDLLFERSYYEYCLDYSYVMEYLVKAQGIVHLNGFASVVPKIHSALLPNDYGKFEFSLFAGTEDWYAYAIELFDRSLRFHPADQLVSQIKFAWVNPESVRTAVTAATGSTILAVVGYSFPYFNREADQVVLSAMAPSLVKILLQVNGSIGPKERLLSILRQVAPTGIWEHKIEDIADADQIVIPNELIE